MTPAEAQRALRARRKRDGICSRCPDQARPGLSTCKACGERASKSHVRWQGENRAAVNLAQRARYEGKRKEGTCSRCPERARPGLSVCHACAAAMSEAGKRSYARRREESRCADCGRQSALSLSLCGDCSRKAKDRSSDPVRVESSREWRARRWREQLYSTMLSRAKKKGIAVVDIGPDDIPDPTGRSCPVFGTEFVVGVGSSDQYSATVDRIVPSLGYVRGNVRLLSRLANSVKSNAGPDIIVSVASAVMAAEASLPYVVRPTPDMEDRRRRMIVQKRALNKRKRNLEFSIGWEDIPIPEFCPCTGVRLDSGGWESRPSIDRIDNRAGYVPGNVWVISSLANAIKSSATGEQIMKVGLFMAAEAAATL